MRVLCLILLAVLCFNQVSIAQETNTKISETDVKENPVPVEEQEDAPKPIFDLIANGQVEEVKEMLRDSVDYYAHDKNGETALTLAIQNDDVDMVKLLVKDAVINMKNEEGETPLTLAIKKGNPEIIKLVCRRAKGSLKNNMGQTPLYLAVEREDLFLVEELIQKGANVNRKSNGTFILWTSILSSSNPVREALCVRAQRTTVPSCMSAAKPFIPMIFRS